MPGARKFGSMRWTTRGGVSCLAIAGAAALGISVMGGAAERAEPGAQGQADKKEASEPVRLVIEFERTDASPNWSVKIEGQIGETNFDYTGEIQSVQVDAEEPKLVAVPPLPGFGPDHMVVSKIMGLAGSMISRPTLHLNRLSFKIKDGDQGLRKRARDPADHPPAPYTMTMTTSLSPTFRMRDLESGAWLSMQQSYLDLGRRFGLDRNDLQDLIAYRLGPDEVVAAFRRARVSASEPTDPSAIAVELAGYREIRLDTPSIPGVRIELHQVFRGPLTDLSRMEQTLEGQMSDSIERIKTNAGQ
ncbi:MAG: hypothetical protein LAT64_10560 [Phycisphaerales bacterium]|nr:hypothetical protein [Planctomycetota bacterium]MCH8509193.1 hypothetical protein [Phycisphaerales bacterium]